VFFSFLVFGYSIDHLEIYLLAIIDFDLMAAFIQVFLVI